MRDYEPDRRGLREMLAGREMQQACMEAARPIATAWAALTPRDTGETAASTSVEADRAPDGRAGAKVTQQGASVPINFGNETTRAGGYVYDALGRVT